MEHNIIKKIFESLSLPSYLQNLLELNGFRSIQDLKQLDENGLIAIESFVAKGNIRNKDPAYVMKMIGREMDDFQNYSIPYLDRCKLVL